MSPAEKAKMERQITEGLRQGIIMPSTLCMCVQVYGPNNKADIQNQQDLQAAFDDIFFQYQVDMTW